MSNVDTPTLSPVQQALQAIANPEAPKPAGPSATIDANPDLTRTIGVQEYGRGTYVNKKGSRHEVVFRRRVGNNLGEHFPASDLVVLMLTGAITDLIAEAGRADATALGKALSSATAEMSEEQFCDFVDALNSSRQ